MPKALNTCKSPWKHHKTANSHPKVTIKSVIINLDLLRNRNMTLLKGPQKNIVVFICFFPGLLEGKPPPSNRRPLLSIPSEVASTYQADTTLERGGVAGSESSGPRSRLKRFLVFFCVFYWFPSVFLLGFQRFCWWFCHVSDGFAFGLSI